MGMTVRFSMVNVSVRFNPLAASSAGTKVNPDARKVATNRVRTRAFSISVVPVQAVNLQGEIKVPGKFASQLKAQVVEEKAVTIQSLADYELGPIKSVRGSVNAS